MINLGLLAVLAIIALVYLSLLYFLLSSVFRSESRSGVRQSLGLVALLILLAAPVSLVFLARHTPEARGIDDPINVSDESGSFTIRSIHMDAPRYRAGRPQFGETTYQSEAILEVENNSAQPIKVKLEYYANSGSTGFYSPGAYGMAEIETAPPNWSGELTFPVRHFRFVSGGSLSVTLSTDSETLIEKQYDMVLEE